MIVNGRIVNDKTGDDAGLPIDVSEDLVGDPPRDAAPEADGPDDAPPVDVAEVQAAAVAGDAWLVVEAGLKLPDAVDVDGDGLPDLADADIPGRPDRLTDPRFDFNAIAPGAWPAAFTNPFLIDVAGDGWKAPGLAP